MMNVISWLSTSYLHTALMEWTACMLYILLSKRRYNGWKFAGLSLAALLMQMTIVYATSFRPVPISFLPWLLLRMPLYLLGMWVMIRILCDGTALDAGYLCMRAFLLAEFTWSILYEYIYWTVFPALSIDRKESPAVTWLCAVCVYILVFSVMYVLEQRIFFKMDHYPITKHEFAVGGFITVVIFLMTALFSNSSNVQVFGGVIKLSHALLDLLGIVFLMQYHLWYTNLQAKQELDAIRRVMDKQKAQYESSRENIQLVNQKYHDIKQMLTVMRSELDQQQKLDYLKEVEEELRDHEAWYHTGNSVLNVMLTEKHQYCLRNGIRLSCVVDGKLLEGMAASDICAIFGNTLDNAIDHVSQIEDSEKRLIHVSLFEKQGFLNISVENVCEVERLVVQDGIPLTTKEEKDYHGYGIKSIQYVVSKYHGMMTIDTSEGWFRLKALFPLPLST